MRMVHYVRGFLYWVVQVILGGRPMVLIERRAQVLTSGRFGRVLLRWAYLAQDGLGRHWLTMDRFGWRRLPNGRRRVLVSEALIARHQAEAL